jgi:SMI1-KNR4 cell-wall
MPIFIADTISPPPPPARIETLQQSFEQRFPAAYLDFLKRANGAMLQDNAVKFGSSDFVIERFLPILADPKTDPDGWADVAVVATQLDSRLVADEDSTHLDLVPIAALFAGDFLVLDYRERNKPPKVALWDHEASDDFEPQTVPVAESFETFMTMLDNRVA